jgi:hypothetical protein
MEEEKEGKKEKNHLFIFLFLSTLYLKHFPRTEFGKLERFC